LFQIKDNPKSHAQQRKSVQTGRREAGKRRKNNEGGGRKQVPTIHGQPKKERPIRTFYSSRTGGEKKEEYRKSGVRNKEKGKRRGRNVI